LRELEIDEGEEMQEMIEEPWLLARLFKKPFNSTYLTLHLHSITQFP